MEPRFHAGDLVLVRSQGSYRVGEIVAYHSTVLHRIVLHRIIGRAGTRYIFKGDNNNFVDFEHPAAASSSGRCGCTFRAPAPGWSRCARRRWSERSSRFRSLLFAGAAFTRRRRRNRREAAAPTRAGVRRGNRRICPPSRARRARRSASSRCCRSSRWRCSRSPARHLASAHQHRLPAERRALLFGDRLAGPGIPGQPRRHRRPAVHPRPQHGLAPLRVPVPHGRPALARRDGLALRRPSPRPAGGRRRSSSRRRGASAAIARVLTATLDLRSLLSLVRRVESTTAVGGSYTLTLVPHVRAAGSLDGIPLGTAFSPPIRFSLNPLEVQPVVSPAGGSLTGAAGRSKSVRSVHCGLRDGPALPAELPLAQDRAHLGGDSASDRARRDRPRPLCHGGDARVPSNTTPGRVGRHPGTVRPADRSGGAGMAAARSGGDRRLRHGVAGPDRRALRPLDPLRGARRRRGLLGHGRERAVPLPLRERRVGRAARMGARVRGPQRCGPRRRRRTGSRAWSRRRQARRTRRRSRPRRTAGAETGWEGADWGPRAGLVYSPHPDLD